MTTTVNDLVRHRPLGLSLLTSGYDAAGISWSHSSDLDDPSPFLEPGQMLLTTGRQFASFRGQDDYTAYVSTLAAAGVVAIGFGTEVLRSGTPVELREACERARLALFEVPYATPFIAVSKFLADRLAAESRRQLEWALGAQEAVSTAVLGSGGLAAAVRSATDALQCRVAVLDSDGGLLEGSAPTWLRQRAESLLRRGSRARDDGDDQGAHWIAQTLGRSGRLLGAVVAVRSEALTPAEASVITLLSALTEVSLEHAEDQRLGFRAIGQQLFGLLQDGGVETVREVLEHHPVQLPVEPFRVIAVDSDDLAPTLRDSLERMAAGRRRRMFVVERAGQLIILVDSTSRQLVETKLAEARRRSGISSEALWNGLDDAVTQAASALAASTGERAVVFEELMAGTVLGLLAESRVADVARLRLGALLSSADGRSRLQEGAAWLAHNCAWDPAARELRLHRHTLKQRIRELGSALDLPLDGFRGRAELWALLSAAGVTDGDRGRTQSGSSAEVVAAE